MLFCLQLDYSTNNCIVNPNLIKIIYNIISFLCAILPKLSLQRYKPCYFTVNYFTIHIILPFTIITSYYFTVLQFVLTKKIVGYSPTIFTLLISVCFSSLYSLCAFIVALIFLTLSVCSIKLLVFHTNISPFTVSNLYILIIP